AIARLHPRATVTEGEKDTRGDRTFFRFELAIDGEESDIEIAPDGTVIREEAGGQDEDDDDEEDAEDDDGDEAKGKQKTEGDNAKPAAGAGREVF
ncbi:MAG: hypothetical protein ACYTFI_22790, partial [Planctomycetota bacterium]